MSHQVTPMQEAFRQYVASINPAINQKVASELAHVRQKVEHEGKWQEHDEWRISTVFDVEISSEPFSGKLLYVVRVECDGQEFKARCPSIEKAYLVSKFYRRVIFEQFYSVGPAWS